MVVFGHFYDGFDLFWIPVTVGLMIFSYSSGFFTAGKYKENFDKTNFWKQKFYRIGITLLFADLFLLILFILQKRPDLFTWQTIISALGLTGLLNWFHIPNNTPFGAGLWFLTLLYLFYLAYPLLLKITRRKKIAVAFCFVYTIIMWILNSAIPYGHMLWLTSCGFVFGVAVRRFNFHMKRKFSISLILFSILSMIFCNFIFSIKLFNVILILTFSVALMLAIEDFRIPDCIIRATSFFNGTIFLIYILHPYLFFDVFKSSFGNTILSMIIVSLICRGMEIILKKTYKRSLL